ncbi:MAG: gliding motility-associated C-terminal domain-containing protein [Sediminicola sp.]
MKMQIAAYLPLAFLCLFPVLLQGQTITIEAGEDAQEEGSVPGSFIVTRQGGGVFATTTVFYTVTGSATPGDDYTALSGSVTISLFSNPATIEVTGIVDDILLEGSESITVTIDPGDYTIAAPPDNTATITIEDNDCVAAPVFNDLSRIFCDDISQPLNDYVDIVPAGVQLIWSRSSNPQLVPPRLGPNPVVTTAATYFAFFYDGINDCYSQVTPLELQLNVSPVITVEEPEPFCGEEEVELEATASEEATIRWYASPTSTDALEVGPEFEVTVSETTIFYVEGTANGCTSDRVPVTVTVYGEPNAGNATDTTACNATEGPASDTLVDLDDTLVGNDPGTWALTDAPNGATASINSQNVVDFSGLSEGEYEFTFTTNTAQTPCSDQSTTVTVTVANCIFDTDGDGLTDGEEAEIGSDPLDPCDPNLTGGCVDLSIEKSVDISNPIIGDEVVFTIVLNNMGPDAVTDIAVSDVLDPSGFEYISHNVSNGSYDPDTGSWELEEMEGSEEAILEITVTMVGEGTFTNTADIVNLPANDRNEANNTATVSVVVGQPDDIDLGIEKTVDRENAIIGDEVVFTIVLTNLGQQVVGAITATDLLDPIGFDYVSHTVSNGSYDPDSGNWELPSMEGTEEATLEITVILVGEGTFANTAEITASTPNDGNEENDSATVSVVVGPKLDDECGFVFNQFSPNGDGTNDLLVINCSEQFPNNSLEVYDRYGNQVYSANGYDNSWDGTGKNGNLPKGTYFYILNLGDGSEVRKGWIQIIR